MILSGPNINRFLISFVRYSISHLRTKHTLGAVHKVIYRVFQSWLISIWINLINIYMLICSDLNP